MSVPDIVLDLPAPPSVNRTRRVDWRGMGRFKGWTRNADALVLASRGRMVNPQRWAPPLMRFEVRIVMSEHHTKIDLDNGVKWLIDYLRRIEVIVDDGPKHMRRLVVEWGLAPEGCRITLRPIA